jgi:hypothetical protein
MKAIAKSRMTPFPFASPGRFPQCMELVPRAGIELISFPHSAFRIPHSKGISAHARL